MGRKREYDGIYGRQAAYLKKSTQINLYCRPSVKEDLKVRAKAENMSLNAYIFKELGYTDYGPKEEKA